MINSNQYNYLSGGYAYNIPSFYSSVRNMITSIKKKIDSLLHKLSDGISSYLINSLKGNLDLFENLLRELTYYNREIYDFLSIKYMYLYILENKRYDFMDVLNNLFEEFSNVISGKLKNNDEEYQHCYEHVTDNLIDTEEYFYLNICKKSEYFDVSVLSTLSNNILK